MLWLAFVSIDGKKSFIEGSSFDYNSKADFKKSLRSNGYKVIHCHPKDAYNWILKNTNCDGLDHKLAESHSVADLDAHYDDLVRNFILKGV